MSIDSFSDNNIFSFGSLKSVGNHMISKHHHSLFEIYYLVSGKCRYFIDNKTYEILPGDIVLIPEEIIHRTDYCGGAHERLLINCSRRFIPESVVPKLNAMIYHYRNPEITKKIYSLMKEIENEYSNPDEYTKDALLYFTGEIFLTLARAGNTIKTEENEPCAFIGEVVRYIQSNFMSEIRLSDMASKHSVSSEHLSRTFKKKTGFGFNEYITLIRLQKAEYMLKEETPKSVSEIAYLCGFNDSNYFSDKFKKTYGVSPLKFKQNFK